MPQKTTVGRYLGNPPTSITRLERPNLYRKPLEVEKEKTEMMQDTVVELSEESTANPVEVSENEEYDTLYHVPTLEESDAKAYKMTLARQALLVPFSGKTGLLNIFKNVIDSCVADDNSIIVYRHSYVGTWKQNDNVSWAIYDIDAFPFVGENTIGKRISELSYAIAVRNTDKAVMVCRKGSTNRNTGFAPTNTPLKIQVRTERGKLHDYIMAKPFGVKSDGSIARGDLTALCNWLHLSQTGSDTEQITAYKSKVAHFIVAIENQLTYAKEIAFKSNKPDIEEVESVELDDFMLI